MLARWLRARRAISFGLPAFRLAFVRPHPQPVVSFAPFNPPRPRKRPAIRCLLSHPETERASHGVHNFTPD